MSKQILFGLDARQKLLEGSRILTDAVASTLGPRGQNVAIDRGYDILVVHDGVTVAKAIDSNDATQNAGIRLVREAANKQVDEVGDGTTVVTILANAIIEECLKATAIGINAMSLRRGLENASHYLVDQLDKLATPVKTLQETIQVATISAEDPELGKLVGEILYKIGVEGIVTVDESKAAETYVEHQIGMQFDKGYIAYEFINNPQRNESTIENASILICDRNIVNFTELVPLFDKLQKATIRNLVVIAPDVTDSALTSLVLTKLQGGANVNAIRAPLYGDKQKAFLQDIAVLTGATVISENAGMKLESAEIIHLGKAQRVTSTKDATIIVGGAGHQSIIEERVQSIRAEFERQEGSAYEMEKLRERIAKLSGGVAVIKVGGHTEVEMKERKERAIDAVAATQAAMEEGIVPGGEVSYLLASESLTTTENAEQILFTAIKRPFMKLVENAGMDGGQMLERLLASKIRNAGVDVTDGKIKDMIKSGIIDPVKVPKSAIRNAVSVAIQVMTTNVVITEEPKKEEKK